jgi:hypothetical protein
VPFGEEVPRGPWDIAGIHGLQRQRRWDAVVTVEALGLKGDRALFVALPAGRLVVEEGPTAPDPFARAIDEELSRPYRAEAVRRERRLWAVAANAIETVELPGMAGQEIELISHGSDRMLAIDGERSFGTIDALERASSRPCAADRSRPLGDRGRSALSEAAPTRAPATRA